MYERGEGGSLTVETLSFCILDRLVKIEYNEIMKKETSETVEYLISFIIAIMLAFFPMGMFNRHQIKEQKTPTVTPTTIPTPTLTPCDEPMCYIRRKGQSLGYDDYTITKFIELAKVESSLNPKAKNPNSTAKGLYQFIDSTFALYCKGDVYNYKDNVNCFYSILEREGYPRGLRHWKVSLEKAGL